MNNKQLASCNNLQNKMTNLELEQLERLLTKYHLETESPLGLGNIRPCLFMVREKLALIGGGYSTAEKEITFESYPISYIQQLEQEIENNHPSRLTSEDIEDVSDNYQAHLEYKWWKEEQLELIKDLKSKLTPKQLEWYNSFNDLKNECELNGLENQSNEQ